LLCFGVLAVIRLSLVALGFGRTYRSVEWLTQSRATSGSRCTEAATATAERVAVAAAFFPGRARCLEQSLALYGLLRRADLSATFRLGVQAYPFAAHAWVEHGGEPVNEQRDLLKVYVPLPDQPRRIR
jgi:hypothetical protein